jgi:hypothetical protein
VLTDHRFAKLTRHWKRSRATFVKRSHALSTQVLLSFYLHNVTWNTIQLPIPLTIQKCVNGMKHIRIEIVGTLPPLSQYSMDTLTYVRTYVRTYAVGEGPALHIQRLYLITCAYTRPGDARLSMSICGFPTFGSNVWLYTR